MSAVPHLIYSIFKALRIKHYMHLAANMELQGRNYGSMKKLGCLADSGNAKEFLKGTEVTEQV